MSSFWLPTAAPDDRKAMGNFAVGFSVLLALFFCGLLPWVLNKPIPLWPLFVSACLLAMALLFPKAIYPVYRIWMAIASIVSWVNTRLIMLFAFYVMVLPLGFVLKALGKLQYRHVRWDQRQSQSYWQPRNDKPDKRNLKEPF